MGVLNRKSATWCIEKSFSFLLLIPLGFTFNTAVAYDHTADYSAWVKFLKGSVGGGDEVLGALQMFAGYMLTGRTQEEKLLYINGPSRAGKGVFSETLHSLLPEPIAQARSSLSEMRIPITSI